MSEVNYGAGALAVIALASVGAAALVLLAIRRWSDQQALSRAKASAQAHLLEFRLFMDDPIVLLRSQRALLKDNARVLQLLLKPVLIISVPMALLMWQLDALYGRAPLRVGEPAVVSADSRLNSIIAPDGIAVETKPVHIVLTGETCWRVRPSRQVSGLIKMGGTQTRVVAGTGPSYLPQSLAGRSKVQINYPRATVCGLHWIIWFLLLSAIAGLPLRRVLGVAL